MTRFHDPDGDSPLRHLRTTLSPFRFPAKLKSWKIRAFWQILRVWLGRLDSNQGMAVPKTAALPLGYAPPELKRMPLRQNVA